MGMPKICASETRRRQSITDIIESVALEEAALAHILNAEGEELQKFVHMRHVSPRILFKANDSIKGVIDAITKFEIVLESKLAMFDNCLCNNRRYEDDEEDDDCDCDCDEEDEQ